MNATIPVETQPIVTVATKPHWSATRLKSLLLCPRQFKFAYVDLIPSVPTSPLVFGKVLHQALLFIHQNQMENGGLPPVGETLRQFDELWQQSLDEEHPFFSASAPCPEEHIRIGHELLRAYLKTIADTAPPMAAELSFEINIGDEKLCGIIDRIDEHDDGLVIVDFKSGKRKLSPQEVERDLQLTVYAFAASQLYGRTVARVGQYYLRDGTFIRSLRGPHDFAWLIDEILPYAQRVVSSGQFPPRYGPHCNWCDFREICHLHNVLQKQPESLQQLEQQERQQSESGGEESWHTPRN